MERKKISLNGISEVLSEKELMNAKGGSGDWCLTKFCGPGEACDWWRLICVKAPESYPKIQACVGKNPGDPCGWSGGSGRCNTCQGYTELHCSDVGACD